MTPRQQPGDKVEDLRFDGRTAVVTGAGRGLGREYARLLAALGARVLVNDNGSAMDGTGCSTTPANDVVAEIVSSGGIALADHHSVTTREGATAIIEGALDAWGTVDVVINNAGIAGLSPFGTSSDLFAAHMAVALFGTVLVLQAAWPKLIASGSGRVVNTTSPGILGLRNNTAYAAAKAAVFGLTRTLAIEAAEYGMRVNCLAPAAATTRMADVAKDYPGFDRIAASLPASLNAPVAAYLAHERCAVNGEALTAAGGHVGRFVLSETSGYRNRRLTIEDVASNIDAIMSTSELVIWDDDAQRSGRIVAELELLDTEAKL
jgi:NAD(P)-dependent dehydrogenase (short-subunit alcohol dehydrogenase family)